MSADSAPPPAMDGLTLSDAVPEAEFSKRVPIKSILGRPDKGAGLVGRKVRIGGWVKTGREAEKGTLAFLQVNDGTSPENLQVLVKADVYKVGEVVATGTSVHVEGLLQSPPETATQQKIELQVTSVLSVGTVDAAKYPLPKSKARLPLELLRDVVHLRPRTNIVCNSFSP